MVIRWTTFLNKLRADLLAQAYKVFPAPPATYAYPPNVETQELDNNLPEPFSRQVVKDTIDKNLVLLGKLIQTRINQVQNRDPALNPDPEEEEDDEEEPSFEDQEYQVEVILDVRQDEDGITRYKVKWKYYNSDSNEDDTSWVSERNLNCPELIDEFLASKREEELARAWELI